MEYLEGISSEDHLEAVLNGIAYRSYMNKKAHDAGIPSQPEVQASIQQTYLNALAREVESEIENQSSSVRLSYIPHLKRILTDLFSQNKFFYNVL